MDFSNRNVQPQATGASPQAPAGSSTSKRGKSQNKGQWGRIGVVAAVAAVVILLLSVIVLLFNSGSKPESDYVDNSKLQAVFLNTGQVYFGNVESMNNRYIVLTNIYYLQTSGGNTEAQSNEANANANVSLVKLGCELHEPFDQMVINRDQVTFWENLGSNGQVATAVATFKKQNPDGQKCADQSTSAGTNTGNSAQNAGNGNAGTSNIGTGGGTTNNNANNGTTNP